ncbi:MAG: GntR family transcriptional regulator [Muricomes sp.]|uniref:GntR family transcriptional regulator n=1 Tax=Faecalicatena contorta TaxID=39482 RepID=UPI002EB3205A|nr:GntR family transcriptional regulator [Muricomes sp.]
MSEENLYINVKNKICDLIFNGTYQEGERIPSERILAETLEVSRVTVRKSLDLLETDHLIVREVGSGTRVCFHNYGTASSMDMIVLIAPAKNPFFAEFIAQIQTYAEQEGAMILYVEKPRTETLENCLYRLYKRGLQNTVIWLEDLPVDMEKLKRLRALGMNMVFFDTDKGLPFADCVALDNGKAVRTLCGELQKEGCRDIRYAGWDRRDIYSIACREEACLKETGEDVPFLHLPWECRHHVSEFVLDYLRRYNKPLPEAIVCGDREIAAAVSYSVRRLKEVQIRVAGIDDFPEAGRRQVIIYRQDLEESVKQIFYCLAMQNQKQSEWKAELCKVEGTLTCY